MSGRGPDLPRSWLGAIRITRPSANRPTRASTSSATASWARSASASRIMAGGSRAWRRANVEPGETGWMGGNTGERVEFAEFYKDLNFEQFLPPERTICNGPIAYIGQQEVANDIALFKRALAEAGAQSRGDVPVRAGAGLAGALLPQRILSERRTVFVRAGRRDETRVQGHRGRGLHPAAGRSGAARHLRHDRADAHHRRVPQIRRGADRRAESRARRGCPKIACAITSAGEAGTVRTRTTCR